MEGISATGDIWSTGAFSFESPLKDLLDRGDFTLEELLAEDELLQELRGMHPQLIEFLSTEEAVVGLVNYATKLKQEEDEMPEAVIMNGNHHVSSSPEQTITTESVEQELEEKQQEENKEEAPEKQQDENEETLKQEEEEEKEVEETTTEQQDEEKKPGQWLFPPMENPSFNKRTLEEEKELQTIRYPYMACEVICCEIKSIIDILVDGHVTTMEPVEGKIQDDEASAAVEVTAKNASSPLILDTLFSVLYDTPVGELDDYRAGYFDKILSVLFRKRPRSMSTYMNLGGVALMTAMMNHLYSHSIMQIVQRLLMPPPSSFLANEEDEEEDEENLNALFSCHWSEMPEAIGLLMDSLVGVDSSNGEDDDELLLRKAQSASEVLITVIQNSPLTSATLLTLTSEPVIGRIMKAACTLNDGQDFSPHDSSLTCAMNVLESIVLQLGGYGSVGTALEASQEDETSSQVVESEKGPVVNGDDESIELEVNKIFKATQEVATADALINQLPELLQALCGLLRHPSTKTWQSPMQFAKNEKQQLLGMSRLRIVRLIESLVLLGNPKVDAILCESECLSICLNLFWEFQWCSMLHQSVANLLVHVFEGANERAQLQEYFLVKCNLLGRLMDSFQDPDEEKVVEEGNSLSDAVMALQRLHVKNRSNSVMSERGSPLGSIDAAFGDSDDEVIPVSDDDVDAALEQQTASEQQQQETQETEDKEGTDTDTTEHDSTNAEGNTEDTNEGAEVKSSIPSLRMGCLGHVIIICQALVHACNADANESHEEADESPLEEANESPLMRSIDLGESALVDSHDEGRTEETDVPEQGQDKTGSPTVPDTTEVTETPESSGEQDGLDEDANSQAEMSHSQGSASNDLIIAQLVKSHPLHAEWNDFITSTLATETAIQSTPLGGTNVATVESMQSQLPVTRSDRSYDFNGDDGDDAAGISARGFLGGEVLDMDDNDLDIAASMMEALTLARPRSPDGTDGSDDDDRHDTLSSTYGTVVQNSGTASENYFFDDPLGGNARFGSFGSQDDSSDEEEEPVEGVPGNDEGKDNDDAPVMDLFTGNFDGKSDTTNGPKAAENGGFSDFANFDDAFAEAGAVEAPIFTAGSSSDEDDVQSNPFENPLASGEPVEDLFGTTPPHSLLLGDEEGSEDVPSTQNIVEKASDSADDAEADTDAIDPLDEDPPLAVFQETPSEVSSPEDSAGTKEKMETGMPG